MGLHYAYEQGDKVQWPQTSMPATENSQRFLTVEDRIVTRYASGRYYVRYLFKELMQRIIEDMHCNVEEAFDNLVAIIGHEGVGKSNLAYDICIQFDPEFDIHKSTIYSWQQFIESVSTDPQKVYWLDEAVLLASGRDWMKDTNKMLVKALQLIRSYRLTIIMCIPSFDALDFYIRTFRTRYLIKAMKMKWNQDREAVRGYAELRIPLSEEERRKLPKDVKAEDSFKPVGYFRFPKMDPEASKIYEAMKLENQQAAFREMRDMTEEMSGKSTYRRDKQSLKALVSYLVDMQGMSYMDVSKISGIPYSTIKNMAWAERNKNESDSDEW